MFYNLSNRRAFTKKDIVEKNPAWAFIAKEIVFDTSDFRADCWIFQDFCFGNDEFWNFTIFSLDEV